MCHPPFPIVSLLVVGLLALPGCSFFFSEGPPVGHARMPHFDCAQSNAPPIVDTVIAGLTALTAGSAMATSQSAWDRKRTESRSQVIATNLTMAAITGAAAAYGYARVGACHQARTALEARLSRAPAAPPAGLPPNWPAMAPRNYPSSRSGQ